MGHSLRKQLALSCVHLRRCPERGKQNERWGMDRPGAQPGMPSTQEAMFKNIHT